MLYFRGCVVREKLPQIEMATCMVLKKAGIDYDIVDGEECCGSFLLRTGFTDDALQVMHKTSQNLKDETILVSCAGCYNTLKNDYKKYLGVELDVIHTSQLFSNLIKQGIIKPKKLPVNVCYHDPCHLGRHCGEYQSPREVLASVANLVPMENEKENSHCCGAGGGVKSAYPELASEIALKRVDDALQAGAELLVTCCPFCVLNLESEKLKVIDLTEFFCLCNSVESLENNISKEDILKKSPNTQKKI
ncbi:MAG: CoB--CoM heterodisulfide reductase iron-sulfur subunit D [Methanobacterium sp. PtaB.Bin024]|nr:MAG: CoB--CoM heterodisulfide reductase iron-sulfur subunit D [Methanobacterium sp. PtaB.Bin024]